MLFRSGTVEIENYGPVAADKAAEIALLLDDDIRLTAEGTFPPAK